MIPAPERRYADPRERQGNALGGEQDRPRGQPDPARAASHGPWRTPGTTMHEPTTGRTAASTTLPSSTTSAAACSISGDSWSRPWSARPTCSSDPRSWLNSTLPARRPGVAPTARRSSARTPSTPATPRDAAVRPPGAGARTHTAGSVAEGARTRRRVLRDRQLADRSTAASGRGRARPDRAAGQSDRGRVPERDVWATQQDRPG